MNMKISTQVEEKVWKEFKTLSDETHQSLSGMLTDALSEYVRNKRLRPTFLKQAEASIRDNEELGKLLSK